jgi:predicted AAA+ superfamily ATPase
LDYSVRLLEGLMRETIKTRPLVYLNGMRQCGKSTLVQNMYVKNTSIGKGIQYITFDNPASLSFAKNDPGGFIQQLPQDKLNIIDEVQLAPELFRYFKIAIDENLLAGKNSALYVLT